MENNNKTNRQLLEKIGKLNEKIPELEKYKTDRRQADEQLAAIYQNAPLVMLLVDRERRLLKLNNLATDMARHPDSESIGHRSGDVLMAGEHLHVLGRQCRVRGPVGDCRVPEVVKAAGGDPSPVANPPEP